MSRQTASSSVSTPELAYPALEEVGREVGVAQLAGVGPGVGKAQQQRVVAQQPPDLLLVVVDHDDPEAGVEILGQGELDSDVQRGAAPLGRELAQCGPVAQVRVDHGLLHGGLVELVAPLLPNARVGPLAPGRILHTAPAAFAAFQREDLAEGRHVRQRRGIGEGHLGDDRTAGHLWEDPGAGAAGFCHPTLQVDRHGGVVAYDHDGGPRDGPPDVRGELGAFLDVEVRAPGGFDGPAAGVADSARQGPDLAQLGEPARHRPAEGAAMRFRA